MKKVLVFAFILLFVILSCGKKEAKKEEPVEVTLDKTEMADTIAKIPDFPIDKNVVVVIETDFGNIEMEVFLKETPKTSQNFLKLVSTGFYDSLTFHRAVPKFVIQGGDALGSGAGGVGYYINDEATQKKHKYGSIGMARGGPNTAGSQFYICLRDLPQLDGRYTVFGRVVKGMGAVEEIAKLETDNEILLEKVYIKRVYIRQE